MKQDKQARRKATQALLDAQTKHAKQLKKLEKARARLEKASRKLQAHGDKIAALVHRSDARVQPPGQVTQQFDQHRKALLIFNPRSRGVRDGTYRLEEIVGCLRAYGIDVEIGLKTSGKVARKLAKGAVKQGTDLVIVAAGDGTIEDVASQLVRTNTALGIIPLGTMNNIARSLGVPLNLDDACALLSMETTRQIDIGRVITKDKPQGSYFLETAGVGLGALAAPLGQAMEKGRWAMLLKTLGKFLAFKATTVAVSCDGGEVLEAHTQVVTVSNAPLFAKNMLIAPDAKMDDGLLEVAIYDGMSKLDLERHFIAIADGKRVDEPHISFRRVQRVRITADVPLEANADLEVLAKQQVWEIDIVPHALEAVVGKGIALTLPVEAAPVVPPLAGPQPPRVESDGHQGAEVEPITSAGAAEQGS
jgi:diacylglycerol kinase (ATP)